MRDMKLTRDSNGKEKNREKIFSAEKYTRQEKLLGQEGQSRLASSHVLVLGAGGLGTAALYYLAAAGVGKLTIVDHDRISASNLNRQILYSEKEIGLYKAEQAATRLKEFNSEIEVQAVTQEFNSENGAALIRSCDLVCLAVDNRESRLLANRLCCEYRIPLVDGGIEAFGGYVTAVLPGKTPCLSCWLGEELPAPRTPQVLGATAGILASMEALATIQLLTGNCELAGKMLIFDGLDWSSETIKSEKRKNCPACGQLV